MKPETSLYNKIPPIKNEGFYQNFPGVYCKTCGQTFALYSYSAYQPDGIDENNKPFYVKCALCNKTNSLMNYLDIPESKHYT